MPLPPVSGISSVNAGGFVLRVGAPCRRALRVSWSAKDGRVRRPAPTGCQTKYSKTGQREGQAPPLRGGRERFPGRGQAGTWGVVLGAACSGHCGRIGVPDSHPLPRLVGNRRGCGTISTEILHCIRAQWPGRNETLLENRRADQEIRPYNTSSKIQQNRRTGGHMGPPLRGFRQITAGRGNGRGEPLPYGMAGKHSAAENRRAKPCEAARRVVAPYGHHGPRWAGGSGDPPLWGNFGYA